MNDMTPIAAVREIAAAAGSVAVSRIEPDPGNPRRHFDEAELAELAASIAERGLLQPILVRPAGGERYRIVFGERRWRAFTRAHGPDAAMPVLICEMSDAEALQAQIDENEVRVAPSETEQAEAAARVLAACEGDRAEAIARLGWRASRFDRRMALTKLSPAVKKALNERRIKLGHAELLAAAPADKQDKALETILSSGIDVATTRDLLSRLTHSLKAAPFDKAECAGCQYNSTLQRTLFETTVGDGACTNPTCYDLKAEQARKEREASAAAAQAQRAEAERAAAAMAASR